jgi:hypothetical protein
MPTTTAIATIDQSPILPVWMIDEPIHTEANNFTCGDPTCPCAEDAPVIVSSICDDPYCSCRDEYQDYIDDDYPSEDEIEAMYSDYSGWQSDYL